MIALPALLLPAMLMGAADLAMNGSPYTPIVTRNIFGLIPIPTNPPVDLSSLTPPPKITPNGIMTIFGKKEALYKVAMPPKPGKPAEDQSYVMSEGESQDDIEVVKIDDVADTITFNNHGTIQELPLSAAPDLSSPGAGPSLAGNSGFPIPAGGGGVGGRFARSLGGAGFPSRRGFAFPNVGNANPSSATSPFAGGATSNSSSDPNSVSDVDGLSPEAQALLIEQNRINTQEQVDKGTYPALPITPITPREATGADGMPLINSPEPPQ